MRSSLCAAAAGAASTHLSSALLSQFFYGRAGKKMRALLFDFRTRCTKLPLQPPVAVETDCNRSQLPAKLAELL